MSTLCFDCLQLKYLWIGYESSSIESYTHLDLARYLGRHCASLNYMGKHANHSSHKTTWECEIGINGSFSWDKC
jgi:hypothetical protein